MSDINAETPETDSILQAEDVVVPLFVPVDEYPVRDGGRQIEGLSPLLITKIIKRKGLKCGNVTCLKFKEIPGEYESAFFKKQQPKKP